jgi:hypothetical protein
MSTEYANATICKYRGTQTEIRNDELKYRKHKTARISMNQPRHCPARRREHFKHRWSNGLTKTNPFQFSVVYKELENGNAYES